MTSNKNRLKNAVKSLNISEPYQLPSGSLQFQAPPKESMDQTTTGSNDQPPEQPVVKKTTGKKSQGGVFIIPHSLFEELNRLPLTKNELKVLNCLLRYSLGFHRITCQIGIAFIAEWSGISDKKNVSRTLKRLLAKKYILKIKEHNSYTQEGTIYEIPIARKYLNSHGSKQPVVSSSQGAKQPPTRGQNKHRPVVKSPTNKININKLKINSLSCEEVESYFQKLPKKKQAAELAELEGLLESHSPEVIADCFRHVQSHGDIGKGKKVHSPFKYLSMAISSVWDEVVKEQESQKNQLEKQRMRKVREAEQQRLEQEQEVALEKANRDQKKLERDAFEKAFPEASDRQKIIAETIKGIPFQVPESMQESIAISRWYEQNHETQVLEHCKFF